MRNAGASKINDVMLSFNSCNNFQKNPPQHAFYVAALLSKYVNLILE